MKKLVAMFLTVLMLLTVCVSAAPSSWALEEVNKAISLEIVPGRIQSDYQNPITREEFCEMVMLVFGKISNQEITAAQNVFTDTTNESVLKAYSAGIVQGTSETTFSPDAYVTRQEICTMLSRAVIKANHASAPSKSYPNTFPDQASIADWALLNVQYMNINAIMLGDENGNINPLGNTTREQAILLTYRLIGSLNESADNYILSQFMASSGNTQCNMINGAFCIYRDGTLYVSDGNTVRAVTDEGESVILAEGADRILSLSSTIYYIKKADSKIYKKDLKSLEEVLLCDMKASELSAINDKIYFINPDDNAVYYVSNTGGEAAKYEEGGVQCPLSAGTDMFVTDNSAIYKIDKDGTKTTVYEGANKKVTVKNTELYFIDAEEYLCKVNADGTGFARVSKIQVKSYSTALNNIIALTPSGEVYKLDYNGRYTIKIEFDTYENINTYDKYVYGKKATGEVIKFENDSTNKAAL